MASFEMEDVFYESVLRSLTSQGSYGRYVGRRVVRFDGGSYSLLKFLGEVVRRYGSIDLGELSYILGGGVTAWRSTNAP